MFRILTLTVAVGLTAALAAQSTSRQDLERGLAAWDQRLSRTAIDALQRAAREPSTAAEALEALGRIYAFKGWLQENIFPGWHDEPAYRERAIATLKAAVAADPSRASTREALQSAERMMTAEAVDPAPPRPDVAALDARLEAFRSNTSAPIAELVAAIEARIAAQADPAPYFSGAQLLIERGEYDRAIALAERGRIASDRFVDENVSAYQMSGKLQGSYSRGRSVAADLTGWALFKKNTDVAAAAAKLEEAERLNQGQDFTNQFHLAELERSRNRLDAARAHLLNALSLTAGPAPLRRAATDALRALESSRDDFDAWLAAELERRRDERRTAALRSLVDRPLPSLGLTGLDGRPFDTRSIQGKVLLLNFFASW